MLSYNLTDTGVNRSVATTIRATTVSESVVTMRTRVLTVTQQVTNGDFKTPNPHTYVKTVRESKGQTSVIKSGAYGAWATQIIKGHLMPVDLGFQSNPDWAAMEDECMGKIYEHLRSGVNLAVDLAERKQTLKLVRNGLLAVRTVRDIARKLKREPWNVPAEMWLTYRYGVMPLIYTTYDVLDALLRRESERDILFTESSSRLRLGVLYSKTGSGTYASPFVERWTDLSSDRTRIGILFKRPVTGAYDWTSLNPLGIAWELLPLSFVGDWFVNVGDFLALWENYILFQSSFISGYRTQTRLMLARELRYGTSSSPPSYWPTGSLRDGNYFTSTFGQGNYRKVSKSRVKLQSLPLPNGIRVRVNLNAKRYADSVSLLKVMSNRPR